MEPKESRIADDAIYVIRSAMKLMSPKGDNWREQPEALQDWKISYTVSADMRHVAVHRRKSREADAEAREQVVHKFSQFALC